MDTPDFDAITIELTPTQAIPWAINVIRTGWIVYWRAVATGNTAEAAAAAWGTGIATTGLHAIAEHAAAGTCPCGNH